MFSPLWTQGWQNPKPFEYLGEGRLGLPLSSDFTLKVKWFPWKTRGSVCYVDYCSPEVLHVLL